MIKNTSHLRNFTPRQIIAIMTLSSGLNLRQTSLKAGISRNTLYRWRQNQSFCEAIELEKLNLINQLDNELLELRLCAVRTLREALNNPDISEGKKISIAFNVVCSLGLNRRLRLIDGKRVRNNFNV